MSTKKLTQVCQKAPENTWMIIKTFGSMFYGQIIQKYNFLHTELQQLCIEGWAKIPSQRRERLINYRKRLVGVIAAKGGTTSLSIRGIRGQLLFQTGALGVA
jgi:hypothetical protein